MVINFNGESTLNQALFIYSFTPDYKLMRKVLLIYFTDKKTVLEKSDKVLNDTELVSTRTGIQTSSCLTPEPLKPMTGDSLIRNSHLPSALAFLHHPQPSACHLRCIPPLLCPALCPEKLTFVDIPLGLAH